MKTFVFVLLLAAAVSATTIVNQDITDAPEAIVEYEEIMETDDGELAEVAAEEDQPLSSNVEIENRRNLSVGTASACCRQLASSQHVRNPIANTVIVQNIAFNLRSCLRISAIRVTRVGASQNATPTIVSGGLNRNSVTIRITSARGRGYNYRIQIHGR